MLQREETEGDEIQASQEIINNTTKTQTEKIFQNLPSCINRVGRVICFVFDTGICGNFVRAQEGSWLFDFTS